MKLHNQLYRYLNGPFRTPNPKTSQTNGKYENCLHFWDILRTYISVYEYMLTFMFQDMCTYIYIYIYIYIHLYIVDSKSIIRAYSVFIIILHQIKYVSKILTETSAHLYESLRTPSLSRGSKRLRWHTAARVPPSPTRFRKCT